MEGNQFSLYAIPMGHKIIDRDFKPKKEGTCRLIQNVEANQRNAKAVESVYFLAVGLEKRSYVIGCMYKRNYAGSLACTHISYGALLLMASQTVAGR